MVIFIIISPAMAQDSRRDVSGALTGADPLAPITTGIGQVVKPIIQSPLSPGAQGGMQGGTQGQAVPYSPRGAGGNYYGGDVKKSGQYYEGGARQDGRYSLPDITSKPEGPSTEVGEVGPVGLEPVEQPGPRYESGYPEASPLQTQPMP